MSKVISDYSFTPSTSTLSIFAGQPVDFSQILSITNLSKKRPVFNSVNNTINNLTSYTLTNTGATCVLTCPYVSQFEAGDIFQIIIEDLTEQGASAYAELAFLDGDDLTTEKKTSAIALLQQSKSGNYMLYVSKTSLSAAGNLTLNVYNQVKVDGINIVDALISVITVEQIPSVTTIRGYLITGLGKGEGTIKLGGKFATDAGAITVNAVIYPI